MVTETLKMSRTKKCSVCNAVLQPENIHELNAAKQTLKRLGLSYRDAAICLGVSHPHLSQVLNGQRRSQPLLDRISNLYTRKH